MNYKLAVFEHGKGKPIVLIHGQISTHNYMDPLAHLLAKERKTINFDLLGFGDSPRPKNIDYSVDDHVNAIVYTLSTLKDKPPYTFVGHSMGALICIRLAKTYPKLVQKLVLSALPVMPKGKEYAYLAKEFPGTRLIMRGPYARLLRRIYRAHEAGTGKLAVRFSKRQYAHLPEKVRADTVRHSWESYDRSMKNVVFGYNAIDELSKISVPITILYGSNDHISKDVVKHHDKFARSQIILISVPDARHNLPLEHPEVVAKAVLQV